MTNPLGIFKAGLFVNPKADTHATYGARQSRVLNIENHRIARAEIESWPGYQVTPFVKLAGLAKQVGLEQIFYKDEGGRFGLGSFKALGGAYAVFRLLSAAVKDKLGLVQVSAADLVAGRYADITQNITVTCATDGNHGRSVAWGARMFGCKCVIYIHQGVSDARRRAIEAFGANVVRTSGNYDQSVRQASEEALAQGRFVVSDTSYEGYMEVPRDVMQGYTVMAAEAFEQLAGVRPSHIFVQGGVGGLAAAICAQAWELWGAERPKFIVVEPERAACLFESAKAGRPTAVAGDQPTVMAGLDCGEISLLAWEILETGCDAFMTLSDEAALASMRMLANPPVGDLPIAAGESAVAGLAGALIAMSHPDQRALLQLNAESRVLVFGSEGDTDPELYENIVGRSADAVRKNA